MKFNSKEDVPESFGAPPGLAGNDTLPNYAKTRYVEWTSWASASTIWPNAGGGSSTQGESSGMGTYAHELSHLLGIGDNYNNPYGVPRGAPTLALLHAGPRQLQRAWRPTQAVDDPRHRGRHHGLPAHHARQVPDRPDR